MANAFGSPLKSLRSKVRSLLGERTGEQWDDPDINNWLNDGKDFTCDDQFFPFMLQESTLVITTSTSDYTLPINMKEIVKISDSGGNPYTYLEPNGFDNLSSSSSKTHYTLIGDILRVPLTNETLTIRYFKIPEDMSGDDDKSGAKPQIERLMVLYAYKMGLMQEGFPIEDLERQIIRGLQKYILAQKTRIRGFAPRFKSLREYVVSNNSPQQRSTQL